MHAHLEYSTLPRLADLRIDILLGLCHHFLNAGRMDASIGNQALQRDAGNLPADGVKAGEYNRLRRIIDNKINAGRRFKRFNIAPLAANNTPLHLVIGQGDHRYGAVGHMVGCATLYGQANDVAGAFVGFLPGLGLNIANQQGGVVLRAALHGLHEDSARLFVGQTRYTLQLLELFGVGLLNLLLNVLNFLTRLVELFFLTFQRGQFAVDRVFLLYDSAFHALNLGTPVAYFFVDLTSELKDFVLGLYKRFLLFYLCLLRGFVNDLLGYFFGSTDFLFGNPPADNISNQ